MGKFCHKLGYSWAKLHFQRFQEVPGELPDISRGKKTSNHLRASVMKFSWMLSTTCRNLPAPEAVGLEIRETKKNRVSQHFLLAANHCLTKQDLGFH